MKISASEQAVPEPAARKRWDDPHIVLERPIQVSAQGGPPGGAPGGAPVQPYGFMAPLSSSGLPGGCPPF